MTEVESTRTDTGSGRESQSRDIEESPLILSSKNVDQMEEEKTFPVDEWKVAYMIMMLHGVGTLMPWNMYLNQAFDYFVNFKLREPGNVQIGLNGTEVYHMSGYQEHFFITFTICAQLPNLLLNFSNIFIQLGGDLTKRITLALLVVALCILVTLVCVYIDTSTWTSGFFFMTIVTVIVLNGANGIYQNSIYGVSNLFPGAYTSAVITGSNAAGVFISVLDILTKFAMKGVENVAFAYFSISLFTVIVCFLSFFILKRLPFYKECEALKKEVDQPEEKEEKNCSYYLQVLKDDWPQMANVFLIFFVTLSVFPAIWLGIPPNGDLFTVDSFGEGLYAAVMTFMLFNLFAFIGSVLVGFVQFPSPRGLWLLVVPRLLFIPFFAMCAYSREGRTRRFPVWFHSDVLYTVMAILMSLSSGYLSGLAMMYASQSSKHSRTPVMMASFFLILGVVTGLAFSAVIEKIVLV